MDARLLTRNYCLLDDHLIEVMTSTSTDHTLRFCFGNPTTLCWCPQTENSSLSQIWYQSKDAMSQRATSETSERLKSNSPHFEKSLMKHCTKLEWVETKCPASSQAPPNKDFRMHEVFLKTILLLVKGAEALNLNTQSHDPSHQLSLFCSLFFYDFTKIVFCG